MGRLWRADECAHLDVADSASQVIEEEVRHHEQRRTGQQTRRHDDEPSAR